MKNPLRDEASAFQFVWLTLAGAAVVVAAAYLSAWFGFAVFVVLVAAGLWAIRGGLRDRANTHVVRTSSRTRRILVVANETVGADELAALLQRRAEGIQEDVLVVCPALNSRLRTWTSDEDGARGAAQQRLEASVASLAASGISVTGVVGDGDPLQALEDALRTFPADEIVISTHPPGRSHWLERGVVIEAERRYDVPVTHVVSGRA